LSVVHCGSIRQTATIISMSVEHLRTGDRANVLFRFIKSPEYLRLGMKLVFREGRTKAIGSVSALIPHVSSQASGTRTKTKPQTTTDQSQSNKRSKQTKPTTDLNISDEQNCDIDKNLS
jgi:hypothetical protein